MSVADIPVVILAGGMGTRLREETEFRPKPMVPIGGRPILWHIMKLYSQQGFHRFIICLGYRGEMIKEYFWNYHMMNSDFTVHLNAGNPKVEFDERRSAAEKWTVTLADTGLRSGTGSRVKQIQRYVGDGPFMLTYGDGVADVDAKALLCFHEKHGKIATVTGIHPPSRFGELLTQGERVARFSEKPQTGVGLINGGFFVFQPSFFEYISTDDDCILEKDPLERVAADGQLMVYRHDGFWQCMDTLRDMTYLNELWESGSAPWKRWK